MKFKNAILVTGGAGYIGSNVSLELLNKNKKIIALDNFSNSKIKHLKSLKKKFKDNLKIVKVSILDKKKLFDIFKKNKIQTVIHLAALKSVRESFKKKKLYIKTNIEGTLNILNAMRTYNVNELIFSSSATVYGNSNFFPFIENRIGKSTNPYGYTKIKAERIILNFCNKKNSTLKAVILRYFNPIGGNIKYGLGDFPKKNEDTLMNKLTQCINSKNKIFKIYGNKYPTKDGTCVRDFIHVKDIAIGHIASIKLLKRKKTYKIINLGSGDGYTVLEVVKTFEKILKKKITYKIVNNRKGDAAISFANINHAKKILNWRPKKDLYSMCKSHIVISAK